MAKFFRGTMRELRESSNAEARKLKEAALLLG
jgi:hypothetical protein